MYLWAEAARTFVYVQNKISHSAIGNMIPKEKFTGKKPEVSHLKIFRCQVFVHIPKGQDIEARPFRKEGSVCWIQ